LVARIILARHGETVANAERKLSGHSDVQLTHLGRLQAAALGTRLEREPIAAAYASDLVRARETAEIVLANRGIGACIDARLRELSFGEWEDKTFADIRREWPDEFRRLLTPDASFCAPGGEPLAVTSTRVVAALEDIAAKHEGDTVLVVAHGGTIQLALAGALGMPLDHLFRLATGNCGVSVIEFHRERPLVTLVNDCAHTLSLAEALS
jgi:alpha-ribazole phosphatase